ncbi:MAG: HD domain-containing phosphohydrolase [Bellilinea sp.]
MTTESTTSPNFPQTVQRPRVRFPLRAKITIPYLLLAIGLAIGAGYVVMRIVFDTTEERFSNQLIEIEKLSSEWMVREENRLLKTLRMLSFTEGMADAMQDMDSQRLGELAIGVAAAQGEEKVILLNAQGDVVLGIQKVPGGSAADFSLEYSNGADFASLPFVNKVRSGALDDQGDKFSGVAFHNGTYVFYVSGPLRNSQGQLVGVALVGKTLHTIVNQLREETLAQISLYDTTGKILATTLAEPKPLDTNAATQLISEKEMSILRRKLNDERSFNILDLSYTELLGAWQIRDSEVAGLLGTSMVNNYWITASTPTRIQVGGLVSLLILLVFVVGVEIADRITYPIQGLVTASSQIAAGNLDIRLPSGGNDEVGYLTETFNLMVANLDKSRLDLIQAYDETIAGWATMLDQRDQDTEGHTRRVTELTLEVAHRFGLSEDELVQVRRGALLHDIGKMSIPDQILKKKGKLTAGEWEIMRLHPKVAYDVLYPIEYLRPALDIPYSHHERWDGSGYPRGLAGKEIPLAARIFSVIDVWDAMTSDRPYRPAMDRQVVIEHIFAESGKMFDPQVVEVFWSVIRRTYPDLMDPGLHSEPNDGLE